MSERLYRSRDDRMIAGVAGGLAERLDVDPAVIRIAWAILVIPTGFLALLAYIVAAFVVPDEDDVDRQMGMSVRPTPAGPNWPASQPGRPAPWAAPTPVAPQAGPTPAGMPQAGWPTGPVVAPAPAPLTGPPPPPVAQMPPPTFESRRARRHAERAARHRDRGRGTASVVAGGGLIVLGSWFLVRDYIPALDASRFWPIAVVGLGILLVILALSRRSDAQDGDH